MHEKLEEIKNNLIKNKLSLSVAESCTGGLVSSNLTDISGASEFIFQNFVTYSNDAKVKFLNVNPKTLEAHGAVSSEVAYEMALGLLKYSDVSVATSGILGPNGGSQEKPIGICYIGLGFMKDSMPIIKVIKFQSDKVSKDCLSNRIEIKKDITKNALNLLCDFIKENIKL